MSKKIYVISVFEKMDTKQSPFSTEDSLVPDIGCKVINGWYFNKIDAENIILENETDIWETCYHYAVLEECNEGMYDFSKVKTYYKFNREINKYEEMSKSDIPSVYLEDMFSVSGIGN